MNVITDALRKVTVKSLDKKAVNIDGSMFRITIRDINDKRKFVESCVKSVPALEIPDSVFDNDSVSQTTFRFRLVEFPERQNLLNNYKQVMPAEVYQVLVSKPVYTFLRLDNPIIEAFTKVAVASSLYSLNDVLRITSAGIANETPGDVEKKLRMDLLTVGVMRLIVDVASNAI